jgi:hypothetical protein
MNELSNWAQVPWACAITLVVTGLACVLLALREELDAHHDISDLELLPLPEHWLDPPRRQPL